MKMLVLLMLNNNNPVTERPQPDEYLPFYNTYIALTVNTPVLQTLEALSNSTYEFLSALPATKANYAYAEGKWTIKEVVGHMIDTERIFAYRALCILRGETQPLPGFDQNFYVAEANFNARTLESLTREFQLVRESNLCFLKALKSEQWLATGTVSGHQLSVLAIIHIMAGHELHHLHILKERYLA